jgi:hypothetical protein
LFASQVEFVIDGWEDVVRVHALTSTLKSVKQNVGEIGTTSIVQKLPSVVTR